MLRVCDTAEVHQECVIFGLFVLAALPKAVRMATIGEVEADQVTGCSSSDARLQRKVAGTAYNEAMPWAYRYTWDRSAFALAYPEFTFGRAVSREQVEKLAAPLKQHQVPGCAPLLAVSVMGPGDSDWVVVWRAVGGRECSAV